jgi:hypothetical protein
MTNQSLKRKNMNNLFDKKDLWTKGLELVLDVQTSLHQLIEGRGIVHQNAKNIILKRVHR